VSGLLEIGIQATSPGRPIRERHPAHEVRRGLTFLSTDENRRPSGARQGSEYQTRGAKLGSKGARRSAGGEADHHLPSRPTEPSCLLEHTRWWPTGSVGIVDRNEVERIVFERRSISPGNCRRPSRATSSAIPDDDREIGELSQMRPKGVATELTGGANLSRRKKDPGVGPDVVDQQVWVIGIDVLRRQKFAVLVG